MILPNQTKVPAGQTKVPAGHTKSPLPGQPKSLPGNQKSPTGATKVPAGHTTKSPAGANKVPAGQPKVPYWGNQSPCRAYHTTKSPAGAKKSPAGAIAICQSPCRANQKTKKSPAGAITTTRVSAAQSLPFSHWPEMHTENGRSSNFLQHLFAICLCSFLATAAFYYCAITQIYMAARFSAQQQVGGSIYAGSIYLHLYIARSVADR